MSFLFKTFQERLKSEYELTKAAPKDPFHNLIDTSINL